MVQGIYGMAEAAAELTIAAAFFIELCGREKVRGIGGKALSAVLAFICFEMEAHVHRVMMQSLNNTIFVFLPLLAAVLILLVRGEVFRALAWSVFISGTILIVRMPVVLLCAVRYQSGYAACAAGSHEWSSICILVLYFIIFLICLVNKTGIICFLKNVPFQNMIFLIIGLAEIAIVLYVINVDWKTGDDIDSVILGVVLMMFLFFVCISVSFVIILEYQEIARVNHMLCSNEAKMRLNYDMLSGEIAKNCKTAHDRRHDLEYIYECIKGQEYEKGLRYIETISALYENVYKRNTWTGYGTVDYLINKAIYKCHENDVKISSDIEFTLIPIKEYDFFTVLANLLDNSIEAAMKCEKEKRYIEVNLKSFHNNFSIYISNGYQHEPRKDGDRFISDKPADKNHGWGVECVRDVVKKYDGIIDIAYHDGKFAVDIMFIG